MPANAKMEKFTIKRKLNVRTVGLGWFWAISGSLLEQLREHSYSSSSSLQSYASAAAKKPMRMPQIQKIWKIVDKTPTGAGRNCHWQESTKNMKPNLMRLILWCNRSNPPRDSGPALNIGVSDSSGKIYSKKHKSLDSWQINRYQSPFKYNISSEWNGAQAVWKNVAAETAWRALGFFIFGFSAFFLRIEVESVVHWFHGLSRNEGNAVAGEPTKRRGRAG